jgi:transcriptional regulator with XRE-family HTH domain
VEQIVAPDLGADQARTALRSLMTRLELSQDDLGRAFGVSGESVRRWERGATSIPAERRSEILAAEAGLRRLQDLFRPERLPSAIRRPAELFDGDSALEWILRGRIEEVADHYETALLYQG